MTNDKMETYFVGACQGCGKNSKLTMVNGVLLCVVCEDELFEKIISDEQAKMEGKEYVANEMSKKVE